MTLTTHVEARLPLCAPGSYWSPMLRLCLSLYLGCTAGQPSADAGAWIPEAQPQRETPRKTTQLWSSAAAAQAELGVERGEELLEQSVESRWIQAAPLRPVGAWGPKAFWVNLRPTGRGNC